MGQMIEKARNQMNNWRWGNPHAFGDQVNCSDLQTPSSGKVKRTWECFSRYGRDDSSAKIEPPSCQQYKPGSFLANRPLDWDEIIDEGDDDKNRAEHGVPSGGRSCPCDGNDNDDS